MQIDLDVLMLLVKLVFLEAYLQGGSHTLKQAEEAWEQFDFNKIKEDLSDRSLADK